MSAISRLTGFILLFSFATPGQERPLALFTETLKPILETPRRSPFWKSHSWKEVTDLLCLQDSLSTAEPIIPLLRILRHVAIAALVVKDLSMHRVAVAKIVLTEDSRVKPEITKHVVGPLMMHFTHLLILYSPIVWFLLSA